MGESNEYDGTPFLSKLLSRWAGETTQLAGHASAGAVERSDIPLDLVVTVAGG